MRDKFTFFRSYGEALQKLPDEERLKCYDAMIHYALDGVEPDIDGVAAGFFLLMKPNIDNSIKRHENGEKGGRPKAEDNQAETKPKPKRNQNETKTKPNENQNESKGKPYKEKEKDKDKEEDKDKDKDKENNNPPTPLAGDWDYSKHTNLENFNHVLNEDDAGYPIEDKSNIYYLDSHERLFESIMNWMKYKDARKPRASNHYANRMSIEALIKKFISNCEQHGERAVIDVVNDSLAAGYQGIIWDKLTKRPPGKIDWSTV